MIFNKNKNKKVIDNHTKTDISKLSEQLYKPSKFQRLLNFIVKYTIVKSKNRKYFFEHDNRFGNYGYWDKFVIQQRQFCKSIEVYENQTVNIVLKKFRALPEFKHKIGCGSSQLSGKAQKLMIDLYTHYDIDAFSALYNVVHLLCDNKVAYYNNEMVLKDLIALLQADRPYDEKIFQFLLLCWKNWPLTHVKYDDKAVF